MNTINLTWTPQVNMYTIGKLLINCESIVNVIFFTAFTNVNSFLINVGLPLLKWLQSKADDRYSEVLPCFHIGFISKNMGDSRAMYCNMAEQME